MASIRFGRGRNCLRLGEYPNQFGRLGSFPGVRYLSLDKLSAFSILRSSAYSSPVNSNRSIRQLSIDSIFYFCRVNITCSQFVGECDQISHNFINGHMRFRVCRITHCSPLTLLPLAQARNSKLISSRIACSCAGLSDARRDSCILSAASWNAA